MTTKVKMGLAGGLSSLAATSIGAYFGLQSNNDPVTEILNLNLNLQRASKKGRCKVRVQGIGGNGTEQTFSYSDFYKEGGDKREMIAGACLKKLTKVDKDREDAVAVMEKGNNGDYVFKEMRISN
ncbi:hypothetical protein MHF_1322 [Mycoplasma haemofelis Ohio2]|uniref:Uncharacterized protein n=1 Tax=Mycoplasma haemofelis (strain Ohio2) TaxID=859194 RepID=F6FG60_MYCHI|nr:hypothetical protein MHF_1322 [Mycoplasma haemofelis Ohio2]